MQTSLRHGLLGTGLVITLIMTAYISFGPSENTLKAEPAPAVATTRSMNARTPDRAPDTGLDMQSLLHRASEASLANNIFIPKSWYVAPPPVRVVPPRPIVPAAPVAPPLPFVYVGRIQMTPDHWRYFLVKDNQLYIVGPGEIVDNYRIEDTLNGIMNVTYLPLKIKQTLAIEDPS